jgi:hypothetical protein
MQQGGRLGCRRVTHFLVSGVLITFEHFGSPHRNPRPAGNNSTFRSAAVQQEKTFERTIMEKLKESDITDLPPIHDPHKELLGILGWKPVLPLYAEPAPVEPKEDLSEVSIDEIEELLQACFEDYGPERMWTLRHNGYSVFC